MTSYEIVIDGKPRKIELTKTGETSFSVKIDDKPLNVQLQTDKPDFKKEFSITIGDKKYQIELPKIEHEKLFQVRVEEATFKAELKTSTTKAALTAFEPTPLTPITRAVTQKQVVQGAVTAPMTGKVISVKVRKGDQVKAAQVLCIIEAMKMENEITASRAGTVQEVSTSEGSSVNEGEVLFIIG
jgi:biotin carboxyl carrier protein